MNPVIFSNDELFRNAFEAGELVDYLFSCGSQCWDQLEVAYEDYHLWIGLINDRGLQFEYSEYCYDCYHGGC